MEPVSTIRHGDVAVLLFDFSRTTSRDEALARIAAAEHAVARHEPKPVLTVTDVTDAYFDMEVIRALGALALANRPHVKAAAVVGASGSAEEARQLVAGMSNRQLEAFSDREAALEWLGRQV